MDLTRPALSKHIFKKWLLQSKLNAPPQKTPAHSEITCISTCSIKSSYCSCHSSPFALSEATDWLGLMQARCYTRRTRPHVNVQGGTCWGNTLEHGEVEAAWTGMVKWPCCTLNGLTLLHKCNPSSFHATSLTFHLPKSVGKKVIQNMSQPSLTTESCNGAMIINTVLWFPIIAKQRRLRLHAKAVGGASGWSTSWVVMMEKVRRHWFTTPT